MREPKHLLYCAARLEEERALAIAAKNPAVRAIHAGRAAEYEALTTSYYERPSLTFPRSSEEQAGLRDRKCETPGPARQESHSV